MAMKRILDSLPELLKDPEFAKAYQDCEPEFAEYRRKVLARMEAEKAEREAANELVTHDKE